jgi:DNA-binding beta-propeller fold protein YncE
MRTVITIVTLLLLLGGCEPPPLSPNNVTKVFGEAGRGPGAFAYARAIAEAPNGKIYVVDKSARVQRFDASGEFELLWTMPDYAAGKPVGLSIHPDGRVVIADTHYSRVIVFDPEGNELARFGEHGTGDGQFIWPTDVAFDDAGSIYVGEYNGNDRITKWTPDYEFVEVVVSGEVNGQPMRRPAGLVIDEDQTLWVADACNHRILHFDLSGRLLLEFGEMGRKPGQLRYPYDLDIDADGNLLVCEYGNNRLQWFDRTGRSLRIWGSAGRQIGELNSPWGAFASSDGRVFVLDSLNARVQVIGS